MSVTRITNSWYSANGIYKGRVCIGFGRTIFGAIEDCFRDMILTDNL